MRDSVGEPGSPGLGSEPGGPSIRRIAAAVLPSLERLGCSVPCCAAKGVDSQEAHDVAPIALLTDEGRYPASQHQAPGNFKDVFATGDGLVEHPEVEIEGGARYKGQWKATQCHGHGILSRPDGSWYEGSFHCGRVHGHGKFVAKNGSVYEGQWVRDRAHGHGKYISEDGSTFDGEWIEDEKSGKGIERWADGTQYEGHFLHGRKHGHGTYISSTGVIVFEGQFQLDKMDGEGIYSFSDGRTYRGQMVKGHMHGIGEMEWPNGLRYKGNYHEDLRQGEGTLTWPDGRMYRGQWNAGKQDGYGIVVDASGKEKAGQWKNGAQVSACEEHPPERDDRGDLSPVTTPVSQGRPGSPLGPSVREDDIDGESASASNPDVGTDAYGIDHRNSV